MKIVRFQNIKELARVLLNYIHIYNQKELSVCVVANYEYITSLAEELIRCGATIYNIDLTAQHYDGYYKEFTLSLCNNMISVTRAWHGCQNWMPEDYNWIVDDMVLVHQDCNSKLLRRIDTKAKYEFSIAEYDED